MVDTESQDKNNLSGDQKIVPFRAMGYQKDLEKQKVEEELQILTDVERQVAGVLGEIQYIRELLETNKNIGPVEDLPQLIRAAYQKIQSLLNPQNSPDQSTNLEARQGTNGLQLEKNPLIQDLGGMPLETISPEWREDIEGAILDKAELENLVNKKLKDRVELANKLKAKNKLTQQPKLSAGGPPIKPQFQKIQQTLKYIIKEMPPPPTPAPAPPMKPRPYGA